MTAREALAMLRPAVPRGPGRWAELGAGRGTFTAALARLLGEEGLILAVDRDPAAVLALQRLRPGDGSAGIVAAEGDFRDPAALAALDLTLLDGALFANALHFVARPEAVLAAVAYRIRPGGRVVIVEYDRSRGNRWVPHPIPVARLPALAGAAGLTVPRVVARRPSAYQGEMYCAVSTIEADDRGPDVAPARGRTL